MSSSISIFFPVRVGVALRGLGGGLTFILFTLLGICSMVDLLCGVSGDFSQLSIRIVLPITRVAKVCLEREPKVVHFLSIVGVGVVFKEEAS